jgi:hypothetical protein
MKRLSKLRFDALAGYIRNPYSVFFAEELDWFQSGDEKLLGLVSIDTSDNDYVATVLARDQRGRYRAVDLEINLPFREEAIGKLTTMLAALVGKPADFFLSGRRGGTPRRVLPANRRSREDVEHVPSAAGATRLHAGTWDSRRDDVLL